VTPAAGHGLAGIAPPLESLLDPLVGLETGATRLEIASAGTFTVGGERFAIPRLRLRGAEAGAEPMRIGVFAGVHGDEKAGCAALVSFAATLARRPSVLSGYELVAFPVCNPFGYRAGVRENGSGLDLNREFWRGSSEPEVRILEAELRAGNFQGIIALHADDTCQGVYGYAHGRLLNEALLRPALQVASLVLPPDPRGTIDGFAAREGVIHSCFGGVLAAPPDQRPQPFDVIFETPALAPFELQHAATLAALEAILAAYRGFIAYAQEL
jgi:murein peptide amidase A